MGWFKGFTKKQTAAKGFQSQKNAPGLQLQTFILEPILTPSGIIDTDDHSHDLVLDVDTPTLPDVHLAETHPTDAADTSDATSVETHPVSEVDTNSHPFIDPTNADILANHIVDDSISDRDLEHISFFDPADTSSHSDSVAETSDTEFLDGTVTHDRTSTEVAIASPTSEHTITDTQLHSTDTPIDTVSHPIEQHIDSSDTDNTHSTTDITDNLPQTTATDNTDSTTDDVTNNLPATTDIPPIECFPRTDFSSGVFTVGETGEVEVDFLFDGGGYKGEVAIFSLRDMESFTPGSTEFIKEAATRALSDSDFGHVVISDITEAARFSGNLPGEGNQNSGIYLGVKPFQMRAGDEFGVMLVPNGTLQQLFNNPNAGGALRPLFSLVTANPNDHFHIGQIADVTGEGNTFVMEDLRVDTGSDRDYNDIIFQVRGATGKAIHLDEVIAPGKDWRGSDMGQALIAYAEPYVTPDVTEDVDFGDGEIITDVEDDPSDSTTDITDLDNSESPSDSDIADSDNSESPSDSDIADLDNSESSSDSDIADLDNSGSSSDSDIADSDNSESSSDSDIADSDNSESSSDSDIADSDNSESSSDSDIADSTSSQDITQVDTSTVESSTPDVSDKISDSSPSLESENQDVIVDNDSKNEPVTSVVNDPNSSLGESAIASDTTTHTTANDSVAKVASVEPAKVVETVIAPDNSSTTTTTNVTSAVPSTSTVDHSTVATTSTTQTPSAVNNNSTTPASGIASTTEVEHSTQTTTTATSSPTVTTTQTASPVQQPPVKATVPKPPTTFDFPKANQPLVGVIDTGFSANNPDIDYTQIKLGSDYIGNDANPLVQPTEGNNPGTQALGIIAAKQDNGIGINGINDDAPLWVGRAEVSSDQWAESLMEFVDAAKASKQPNAVVNLSFNLTNLDGTPRFELTGAERAALAYAQHNNVLIVASAGDNPGQMSALGKAGLEFDNIITVGAAERVNNAVALSKAYAHADYSGSGAGLDIVADGGSAENPITVTSGEGTAKEFGTSVATAKVTGAVSQVWAANSKLNFTQVIDILKRTATDLGKPNWDADTGAGLLNIAAAVTLAKVTTPEPYTVKPGQETITDNFISQNNAGKQLPGDPAHPAVTPPGIPQTTVDQGANDLSGTRIRISATEDVIDQVSSIDPIDVYRGASRELAGAKFKVLTGQAVVSILSPSGQVLSQQVLTPGTHFLQMPANAPEEVLLKITPNGGDATYVLQGFEAERNEPFDINLEFESPLTASQQQIMQAAARSVASLIGKGLPSAVVDGKIIDDVNIKVSTANLDGASGTQAQTKIDFMRYGTLLPAQSITQFDAADVAELERSGELFSVAQHEFLHALGFGNLWEAKGLVDYAGTPLAQYNGNQAVDAFKELGGLTDAISLETEGKGSAGLHWNEMLFQDEVMTYDLGFKQGSDGQVFSPISAVTIASLADLGYQVNLNRATPDFGLFGGGRFNPDELTPEQIEAFRQLAEESVANQSGEFIPAMMPEVDPNKVAPEIWAHAEKFSKNGEYYDWVPYQIKKDEFLSHLSLRYLGSAGYDYYMWIANHNGIPNPDYIVTGDWIEVPIHHPNYEWEQEQERLRREEELKKKQEEEAQKQKEAEEKLKNDLAEQEKLKQLQEQLKREAEAKQKELEEQAKKLAEELEKKRQHEEWLKEQARLAELARQAEIARQQGKGGQEWYLAKPLPSFGETDPFETSLTGETVGNLVPDDYYRFTLSRNGRITAELKQLLADADLVLYDARNEPIAYSMREGITDEQIVADLIPGTYMLRVNSPKGVTTDYDLIVKFQHKLSMTQQGPPPGWEVGGNNNNGGGSIPPGATFADPRIEKIFKQAVADFAAPERQKAKSKVDALKSERDRLEREKKALIASKSAELRGKVHGMLDRVKSEQQGSVNGIANNIKGGIDGIANGAIGAINGLVPDWVFKTPFVGGWLRDRFNEAKGAIEGAINGARKWLNAKVDEVRNTINNAISWFIDQAKKLYFTAGEANIAIEGIAAQFRGMIENATAALNGLIGTFKGMVLGQIEWTRNIGVPGWNLYDNAIVGLVNNLTNGAQDAVRNTGRFFMDRVGDVEKGVQWVIAEIGNLLGDETGRIYNKYQDQIRSLNNQIEAITNDTDRRIRAKEAEYKNQLQNFLNQLGDEGKKILDTILNFANSPAAQIGMAVLEVILGMIPGVGQAIDIKDTVISINDIFIQGQQTVLNFIGLIGSLAGWVPGPGDAIKSVAKIVMNGGDALADILRKLGPDVVDAVTDTLRKTDFGQVLVDVVDKIGSKWDELVGVLKKIPDWANDLFNKFHNKDSTVQTASGVIVGLKTKARQAGGNISEAQGKFASDISAKKPKKSPNLIGNRAKLAKNLNFEQAFIPGTSVKYPGIKDNYEAHHIIPIAEANKSELILNAVQFAKFDIDGARNGIFLPKDSQQVSAVLEATKGKVNLPLHKGWDEAHAKYSQKIGKILEEKWQKLKNEKKTEDPDELLAAVDFIIDSTKSLMVGS